MSAVRIAVITMSDTRSEETDESGRLLAELLGAAGFAIASRAVLREEPDVLREALAYGCDAGTADVFVITGGTGVAPRDRTLEVLEPLFDKRLDGFGEAFRRLGFERIGPRALLSRAAMGVVRRRIVVALPGSPAAVRLAAEELLAPMLAHAVELASGEPVSHGDHRDHGHAPKKKGGPGGSG